MNYEENNKKVLRRSKVSSTPSSQESVVEQTLAQDTSVSVQKNIKRTKVNFFKKYFVFLLVILVIALALTSAYFYKKSSTNKDDISQAEIKSLVQKVGRLVVLPEGETPTVATVSDPDALRSQEFFIDAKMGDKVLIYSNAKKAILYDPVADKVVAMSSLNIDANKKQETTTTTPASAAPKTEKKN